MEINKIKNIIIGILLLVIVYDTFLIHNINSDVDQMNTKLNNIKSEIEMSQNNIETSISAFKNDVNEQLKFSQSLISGVSTNIKYLDKKVIFEISFVAKEVASDEIVYVSANVDGKIYKEQVQPNGNSEYICSMEIPMVSEIVPVITFESLTGKRSETLETVYIQDYFILNYDMYFTDENTLDIYVYNDNNKELIKDIKSSDNSYLTISKEGESPQKVKINFTDTKEGYQLVSSLDLSNYIKNEGTYSVYFEINTNSGIKYADIGKSANIEVGMNDDIPQIFTASSEYGSILPIFN